MEKDSHKAWSKSSKLDKVRIDRIEKISTDKASLPNDAEFKGYEEKTVQNIKITTDNVLYKLGKYYPPNLKQTSIAKVRMKWTKRNLVSALELYVYLYILITG